MEAKKKALELYNYYEQLGRDFTRGVSMKEFTKLCALIAVDEIIKEYSNVRPMFVYITPPRLRYWIEVKKEIEEL